jgi:hypothetical protein
MITTNGEETRDFTDIRGGGSYAEESSNPLNMVAAYKKSFVGTFSHSMRKYFFQTYSGIPPLSRSSV